MTQIVEVLQGNQTTEVEFPDDMSPQAIEEVLRREFPSAVAPEQAFSFDPEIDKTFSGYVGEIPRGLARGVVGIGESIATGLSSLLPEEQEQAAREKIAEVGEDFREPFLPKAGYEDTLVGKLSEGVGSTAPFLLTGPLGLVRGTTAAIGLGAAAQSGEAVTRAVAEGATEEQIDKAAAFGVIPGVLEGAVPLAISRNFLALRKALGEGAANSLVQSLRRVAVSAGSEGLQEASSEIAQNLIAQNIYSPETGTFTNTGEAFGLGAGVGGIIQGLFELALPRNRAPSFSPTSDSTQNQARDLPTTADLSEITQETVAPDLPATEPTPDISDETLRAETEEKLALIAPNLRGILKGRGLDDIGMTLSYSIDPKSLEGMEDPQDVNALFDPATRTILLGADRIQGFGQMDAPQLQQRFSGLVDHEMVHAVKRMNLWNAAEWGVLENAARRQTNASGQSYLGAAQTSYGNESAEIQSEEAIAELIRDTLAGRTGLAGQPLSLMRRLVEFFRKMGNALTGTGYASFGQVVNDIDSGVLGARPRGGRQATPVATPMIGGSPALASRRLRSNAEGQQVMDLEGMTGEEVAIEEARVAARKENRRVVTEGLKETRKLLRTPEEPLASRGKNRTKSAVKPASLIRPMNKDHIYHVTTTENAKKIAEEGLQHFKTSNWVEAGSGERYGGGDLFAMESELDAVKWAGQMDWALNQSIGSGKISIIKMQRDSLPWSSDEADFVSQVGNEGKWLRRKGVVKPENILDYTQFTRDHLKDYQQRTSEARSILEDDQQPLASRRQKTAKGLRALGDLPRPPRDAGWEQRAKEQGFDTGRVLYHATNQFEFGGKEFERFIPSAAGKLGPGVYTSPNPDYAQRYIAPGPVLQRHGIDVVSGARAIPLFTRGRIANEEEYGQALDFALDDYQTRTTDAVDNVTVKKLAKEILEEQGFAGIERQFSQGSEVVIFDPKNLRSIYANFDPARTESTNLLASRQRLPHGLPESLTVDGSGKMPAHKVVQNFTPSNRSTVTANITKILENNPEALATYNAWVNAEEDAFGGEKVPVPPYQAIAYAANPELLADKLNQLTPDLKATVDEGFGYVNDIKNIYESGTASPELTGRLFLWGILSRGAGPVQQETAFLNILNEATPFIEKSASGNLTQNDLDSWLEIVSGILPEGSPARSVTMNVNAAGKLLFELGKKAEGSDSSVLSVLHDSLSNPNQTAAEFRRKFFALTDKPGIDNKVVSFISLVAGKPDVLVMDRIQSRHLWDDGRFDGANIYDGVKVEGRPQGTGLNEILTGPRGLLITEMLENGLRDSVVQAYEIIGRPQDASLGRMHWETWVIEGNQGVPHSTLQAVKTGSPIGYSVTEGKRGTYASGAAYRQTENGLVVEYLLSDGTLARMTPTQFVAFKKYISKPANKIVPKKFKVSESTERPWFESQGVDRGALDDAARRYENANPDGTIRSSYDESTEAGDSLSSRERTRRAGRGKLKTKPEDSAALAEDKSKAATEVRGNPEADQAASEQLRTVKKLASRNKPSDIVESTAYNRVADISSKRASRGQGNINNALPFEAPSSADDKGIVYQLQDKYIDLKNAISAVKDNQRKRGLTPLIDTENPYLGEESMHGIIGNKFNRFQEDEVKPIADKLVRRKIARKELEEFLVLRHAIERNTHVRELNAQSKQPRLELEDGGAGSLNGERLVDDYVKNEMRSKYRMQWNDSTQSWEGGNRRARVLNDLAADFDAITRGTLQELKDSGLINQDSLDKLKTHYKYYAPLRGVSPDEDIAIEERARISRGAHNLSIGGIETEKAKGRVSEATPPLGQIMMQRQNAIRRGTINDVVGQRMLKLIRENPNDSYWKIHEDREYAGVGASELFGVKEDGKQLFVEFKDKRLRDAMLSLDAAQTGKILGFLRMVNRYYSAIMTQYNPEFVIGNFARDVGTAMGNLVGEQTMVDGKAINTKGLKRAVVGDTVSSIRQVYRGLRGKDLKGDLARDWKEYLESGAKTEWFNVKTPEESSADIDQLIAMAQGTFKGNVSSAKESIGGFVSDANSAVENGVRFATFKKARDLFIKNKVPRDLAVAQAATLAKNLTVNFNRKGNSGELLNGLYLFFNASVQGTANFARGLSSPAKQRMLAAMVSFGALMTLLNEESSEEDDKGDSYYSQIEPWVKERNLVIMKTMNPFYKGDPAAIYTIPLPYGYNVLHVLGMHTAEVGMGIENPQQAAGELVSAALGSFAPVGFGTSSNPVTFALKGATPQIGKPIMEILLNEDFFGAPVYTENFEFGPQVPLSYLSQRSTPEIFKRTTKFLNEMTKGNESKGGKYLDLSWISPDALDYLVGTQIGGVGSFAKRTAKSIGALSDYVQGDYKEGDISVNDIPFLRRGMREITGRQSQSDYYDRRDDIIADDRQVGILRGVERGEYIRENRPTLRMKRALDSSDKRLRNINKRLAKIGDLLLTSPSIEQSIKFEEEQKRLTDLKQAVYDRFNKLFNQRVGRTE